MSNTPSNSNASSDEAQKTNQPGTNPSPAQQNQGDKPASKPAEQQK